MKVNVGIIGMGRIGKQLYRCAGALPEVRVIAIADPHAGNVVARDFQDDLADCKVYEDYQLLLADPQVHAVAICTPHVMHASMVSAALDAGKHVLVEKPLAMSTSQGRELIALAAQVKRVLMVELTHRFYPAFIEACEQVQAGRIGNLLAVEDHLIEPVTTQLQPWLVQRATAGGGVALTNGIHKLDRIAAITGKALTFKSGVAGHGARHGDIEDTAAMLLSIDEQIPVQLLVSWPRGSGALDDELTLFGDRGTLRVWAWRGWRFEPMSPDEQVYEQASYTPEQDQETRTRVAIQNALAEFVAAIVEEREPCPSAQAAVDAQLLVEQFYNHCRIDQP